MVKSKLIVVLLWVFSSCSTLDVFEKTDFFNKHVWETSQKPGFSFEVTDTSTLYNIYVVIRHEATYHYRNIWIRVGMLSPQKPLNEQLLNLQLADQTKGWLGAGVGDVFDHRIKITASPVALKAGTYTFTLQHEMREDPLQGVLAAGIRIEKVKP